jgi:hypothetical protein
MKTHYCSAGNGMSPIVAGLLLDARLPEVIWTIQLIAAALAIIGLIALEAVSRQRSAVSKNAWREGRQRKRTPVE